MDSKAYEAGKQARREGKSTHESNPYLGEPNKRGLRFYTDEQAGSAWACGFRDENDVIYQAKHGRYKELSDFVSHRRRRTRKAL